MPSGVPGCGTYTCMTTAISPSTYAAREQARRPDGRFGQLAHDRADGIRLATTDGVAEEPYSTDSAYLEASRAVWALEDVENDHAVAEIARRIQSDHPDAHEFAVGFRDEGSGEVSTVIELMDSAGYSVDRFHAADEWSGDDMGTEDPISDAWDQLYTMLAPGASKNYPLADCEAEFPGGGPERSLRRRVERARGRVAQGGSVGGARGEAEGGGRHAEGPRTARGRPRGRHVVSAAGKGAEVARERARRRDGRFGAQAHERANVRLGEGTVEQPPEPAWHAETWLRLAQEIDAAAPRGHDTVPDDGRFDAYRIRPSGSQDAIARLESTNVTEDRPHLADARFVQDRSGTALVARYRDGRGGETPVSVRMGDDPTLRGIERGIFRALDRAKAEGQAQLVDDGTGEEQAMLANLRRRGGA